MKQDRQQYIKCFFKNAFPTEAKAQLSFKRLLQKKETRKIFKNGGVYECLVCGHFHITKRLLNIKPEKEVSEIEIEAEYWKSKLK